MVTFTDENRPPDAKKSPGRRMPSRAKGNAVYLAAAFLGISRSTMRHSATVMTMSTRV